MPGIEVFTISGAPYFGASEASAPAVVPPAARLQNALVALGVTAGGDPALTSIKIDGAIGPATVRAVNAALAKYVGATTLFPRANLDITKVRQYAGALAVLVEERVRKSGGTIPAPQIVKRTPRAALPAASALIVAPPDAPDRRWLFWAAGSAGVLVLLAVAANAVGKKRKVAEA